MSHVVLFEVDLYKIFNM